MKACTDVLGDATLVLVTGLDHELHLTDARATAFAPVREGVDTMPTNRSVQVVLGCAESGGDGASGGPGGQDWIQMLAHRVNRTCQEC